MTAAIEQLNDIKAKFAQFQVGKIRTTELTDAARAALVLTSSLPPQFGEVLNNILDRLESSALFTEESCSFSQTGLLENLEVWIDKAQLRMVESIE
ncbi:MAG: hypothetical protein RLY95_90 [Pseudomonadota bacterium]|jgi:hypothetical protein